MPDLYRSQKHSGEIWSEKVKFKSQAVIYKGTLSPIYGTMTDLAFMRIEFFETSALF